MIVSRSRTFRRWIRLCALIACCSCNLHAESDSACFEYPSVVSHVRQLQSDGYSEEASDCLENALKRYPDNRDIAFAYIRILGQLKRFDEAFQFLNSYAESTAGYSRLKGDLFWYKGATDSACVWYGNAVSQTGEPDSSLLTARGRACHAAEMPPMAPVRLMRISAATRYLQWNRQRTEAASEIGGIVRGNAWSASCLFGLFSRQYADGRMHDVLIDATGALNITKRVVLFLKTAYTPRQDFLAAANIAAGFEWYLPGIWYVSGEGACLKYDVWLYRLTAVLGWDHTWTTGQIRLLSTVAPVRTGALLLRFRLLFHRFIVEPVVGIGVSPTVNSFSTQKLARDEYAAGSGIGFRSTYGLAFFLHGGVEQVRGNRGFFIGSTFEWEPR